MFKTLLVAVVAAFALNLAACSGHSTAEIENTTTGPDGRTSSSKTRMKLDRQGLGAPPIGGMAIGGTAGGGGIAASGGGFLGYSGAYLPAGGYPPGSFGEAPVPGLVGYEPGTYRDAKGRLRCPKGSDGDCKIYAPSNSPLWYQGVRRR
jgi:hypothetical protein